MFMRRLFLGLVSFCIVSAGFLGGFSGDLLPGIGKKANANAGLALIPIRLAQAMRPLSARAQENADLPPVETYFDVMNQIRGDYYGTTPTATKMTYTAIRGMLATIGDPYTSFWDPEEYRRQMEDNRGDFVGIGARLDTTDAKQIVIVEPIKNSPAAKKGVQPGDIILKVDGRAVTGVDINDVVSKIRGKEGSAVALQLQRKVDGQTKFIDVSITRGHVELAAIEYRMLDESRKIGYIALPQFNEQADARFHQAVDRLEAKGMQALVFDLRDNPGGLLNIAQDIASRFIEDGAVVWVQEKNGTRTSLDVETEKHQSRLGREHYPLIVLVNGGSASASEILSGAIQDAGVGKLVGTTTYGKGLVQTIMPIGSPDQPSAVKITTQHYFTRNQRDINKKLDANGNRISGGIKPDYVVDLTEKDLQAMRSAQLATKNPDDMSKDPQVQKALTLIHAALDAKR